MLAGVPSSITVWGCPCDAIAVALTIVAESPFSAEAGDGVERTVSWGHHHIDNGKINDQHIAGGAKTPKSGNNQAYHFFSFTFVIAIAITVIMIIHIARGLPNLRAIGQFYI